MNKKYEKAVKIMAKYVNEHTQIRNCNGDHELITIVNKINQRAKNRPYADTKENLKATIKLRIENRLKTIAKSLPDEGYSMGSKVIVRCGKFTGTDDRRKDYANSCKFSPTHGQIILTITPAELRCISVIGGLVTYIMPNQRNKVKKCYWYKGSGSKQHFVLVKQLGYICAGYHAIDKYAALEGGKMNIEAEKANKKKVANYGKALRLRYSYADSIKVNCVPGTDAFIMRCGLDMSKKYRGSFLIKVAQQKSINSLPYVERMIKSKVAR